MSMALQLHRSRAISNFFALAGTDMPSNRVTEIPNSSIASATRSRNPPQRAASSPAPQASASGLKRRRQEQAQTLGSPISITSSPSRSVTSGSSSRKKVKLERDGFFDALEAASEYPGEEVKISGADDLGRAQLKKCFDILHACGKATDPSASLATTRQSIDGFLEAVFNEWDSGKAKDLPRFELDFLVEAEEVAGRICVVQTHKDIVDCIASDACTANVSAAASYSNNPPMFKLEFSVIDPFTRQPEPFCPIARRDIQWVTTDWVAELRKSLQAKTVAKIHKYNKHLAIWQVRKLILEWAKGSLSLGEEVQGMGFLSREATHVAVIGLGGRRDVDCSL